MLRDMCPEVSPGFRLRPSLSVGLPLRVGRYPVDVSPGFRLRPSLSGLVAARRGGAG